MRPFIAKLAWFLLLQAVLIACIVAPYRPNPYLFWASTVFKHERLAGAASPRIIFVGGSNLAFGLDSELVAQEIPFMPVNMGIDVGLGLDFMLNEVRPHVRAGDVLVISPEYELFLGFRGGQASSLARVIEQRPSGIANLSGPNIATLLDTGFGFFHWIFRNARRNLHEQVIYGPYSVAAFNEYGDAVDHLESPSRAPRLARAMERFERTPVDVSAVRVLNEFHRFCDEHGAEVYLSHPPLPDYYRASARVAEVEAVAHRLLTVPELDRPDEMLFSAEEFWDTEYHLLRRSRDLRTRLIVDRLKRRLGPRFSRR